MIPKSHFFAHYSSYIACFILACLAFVPALAHSGLPAGADIAAHFWRVSELQSQWAEGVFYPSWAEHFYYGYGAPTFQYTASGFYVVAGIIGNLPLIDDVWALKLTWFIALNLCAFGMYTYASRRWGMLGGLVSATAFIFAPALIGNEALGRGAFPVVWGMGWLALSLALLDRYAHIRKGAIWAIVALFGLLWSHNLTAISGMGVILAWLMFTVLIRRATRPYWRGMVVVFIIGCAISAFFWLPVLLERGYVSLDAFQYNPHMRYQDHFYRLDQLLPENPPYNFGVNIQSERFTLGVTTWVAVIGLGLLGITTRRGLPWQTSASSMPISFNSTKIRPYESLFWLIIALATLFLVLPQSQFLWDNIQTLQTFVFPARFLNITALALAMLIGAGIRMIRWRWMASLLIALLIVQGWRNTVIHWRDDFPAEATVRDYLYYEFETNDLATTSANEFRPRTVRDLPPATGFLVDSLINNTPAMRLNPDVYGESVIITPIKSTAEEYIIEISSPVELSLEIFQFYFVGWVATVNDIPIAISPSGDYGFIRTNIIPAGKYTFKLSRVFTPPQQMGLVMSGLAILAGLGWIFFTKQVSVRAQHVAPLRHRNVFFCIGVGIINRHHPHAVHHA